MNNNKKILYRVVAELGEPAVMERSVVLKANPIARVQEGRFRAMERLVTPTRVLPERVATVRVAALKLGQLVLDQVERFRVMEQIVTLIRVLSLQPEHVAMTGHVPLPQRVNVARLAERI